MKFIILSRRAIEEMVAYGKPHIIISIKSPYDPSDVSLPTNEFTLDVLRLSFRELYERVDDEEYNERVINYTKNGEVFTVDTGKEVIDFVMRYMHDVETIIIHCEAGLARSPAVAVALASTIFADQENSFYGGVYTYPDTVKKLKETNLLERKFHPTCYACILDAWKN